SRQERSRWRHTFRRLSGEAQDALRGEHVETAGVAVTAMIDLACETRERDCFRSEDPLEAARVRGLRCGRGGVVADAGGAGRGRTSPPLRREQHACAQRWRLPTTSSTGA